MITLEQIKSKFQEVVKEAITYSGITQSEIARRIRVSPQTVSDYLKGNIMPAFDTFANLCEVLDLDPAEILCLKR
ncbi:MAG: helix-turn-helix domain-containing protein [Clostridia bacterium]|nr:helix-turn-helix domain-containing protein [Clostridia bacterium]